MKTLVYNIRTKSFSSPTHELFELRDGSYKITPMGFNLDLKAKYIMKGTKEECQARKKELEEKNFSNRGEWCCYYLNGDPIYEKGSWEEIKSVEGDYAEFSHYVDSEDKAMAWRYNVSNERNAKSFSKPLEEYPLVKVRTTNPDQLTKLLTTIKDLGNPGHSFDIVCDPDATDEEGRTVIGWDGDGSDQIMDISVENTESKSFSVRDAMNSLDRKKQALDKAENSTKPWKDLLVRKANLNIELSNLRLNYERYFENYQKKSDRIKSEIDNVEEMIEDAKENQ